MNLWDAMPDDLRRMFVEAENRRAGTARQAMWDCEDGGSSPTRRRASRAVRSTGSSPSSPTSRRGRARAPAADPRASGSGSTAAGSRSGSSPEPERRRLLPPLASGRRPPREGSDGVELEKQPARPGDSRRPTGRARLRGPRRPGGLATEAYRLRLSIRQEAMTTTRGPPAPPTTDLPIARLRRVPSRRLPPGNGVQSRRPDSLRRGRATRGEREATRRARGGSSSEGSGPSASRSRLRLPGTPRAGADAAAGSGDRDHGRRARGGRPRSSGAVRLEGSGDERADRSTG